MAAECRTARLLQQQRQGRLIRQWLVVVICPSRELNVGDPIPVQEFVERRLVWIERLSERMPPSVAHLPRASACASSKAAAAASARLHRLPHPGPSPGPMLKPSPRPGSMSRVRKISMPGYGHRTMGLG